MTMHTDVRIEGIQFLIISEPQPPPGAAIVTYSLDGVRLTRDDYMAILCTLQVAMAAKTAAALEMQARRML